MKQEDIKQVQDVAKISWNNTYKDIIPVDVQVNFLKSAYSDEMMQKRLNNSFIYVAETEAGIVGFANFSPIKNDREVELGAIYIIPEYHGVGIGTALLQEGIKKIKGVKEIYINVERDNTIGKVFYEAKGFEVVEEFNEDFDGHILRTVRMVLNIHDYEGK
nr:GNAT family N-acetyltransferase [Gracilibacillus halotolerans]